MKGLLDFIKDSDEQKKFAKSLLDVGNRGIVGGLLGAPVDLATTAMRPFGYDVEKPVMGSEWIGDRMQGLGFVSPQRNMAAESLASLLDPGTIGAAAIKAPVLVASLSKSAKGGLLDVASAMATQHPPPSKGWYRFTKGEKTPMSEWGHAMFADDIDKISGGNYGKHGWEIDASQFPGRDDIYDEVVRTLKADASSDKIDYKLLDDVNSGEVSIDDVAESFFPENIVDSAEGFDNSDYIKWFWDRVAEPMGLKGIKTNDGAISFDPEMISRISTEY